MYIFLDVTKRITQFNLQTYRQGGTIAENLELNSNISQYNVS